VCNTGKCNISGMILALEGSALKQENQLDLEIHEFYRVNKKT